MKNITSQVLKATKAQKRVCISVLHGIFLFFLLWFINNTSFSTSVDEGLFKKIFVLEELISRGKNTDLQNFVFVNTSKDISLIQNPREYGLISITDRQKLSKFFKIIADNNNRHRYILCDLFFEYPTTGDSLLQYQVSRCKNLIFPYHRGSDSTLHPCINVPSALGDYQTYNGRFSRFRLVYPGGLKTIPLVVHEQLDKKPRLNGFDLGCFSPRYYIRPIHLFESKELSYFNLGELLIVSEIDSSFYNSYLKNKFIVIGNFDDDVHYTPAGKSYGPLILINSYLSVKNGRTKLQFGWSLFMLISLSVVSYILFFSPLKTPEIKISPWVQFIVQNFLNKIFSFLSICVLIALLSELLFSIQLTISPLFVYLLYVSWSISYYREHVKNQKTKTL